MKYLREVGILVVGIGIGVGGSFRFFKTKYETIANEEIESVKMMVKNRTLKAEMKPSNAPNADEVRAQFNKMDDVPPEDIIAATKEKISYNKIATKYDTTNVKEFPIKEPQSKQYTTTDKPRILNQDPYVISASAFIEECDNYEKITFTYYESDEVLLDDHEEIVDNVDNLVGKKSFDHFGDGAEKDVVYVRNEKDEADYEIIRSNLSYSKDILGFK